MSGSRADERLRRLSDEELLGLAVEIEPGALEVLYDRHQVPAFSLACRIAGSRDRAQEIVQDAFLDLWRDGRSFDPGRGSVRTWLMATIRQRGIDAMRRLSPTEREHAETAAVRQASASELTTTTESDARDKSSSTRAALEALPPEQRKVIELAYYGGWTQSEIADLLDLPLSAVKGRARLGLLKLHDALAGEVQASP